MDEQVQLADTASATREAQQAVQRSLDWQDRSAADVADGDS